MPDPYLAAPLSGYLLFGLGVLAVWLGLRA